MTGTGPARATLLPAQPQPRGTSQTASPAAGASSSDVLCTLLPSPSLQLIKPRSCSTLGSMLESRDGAGSPAHTKGAFVSFSTKKKKRDLKKQSPSVIWATECAGNQTGCQLVQNP